MKLEFTNEELNYIINILAEKPFSEVYQLIGKIQTQVQNQEKTVEVAE